MLVAAMAAPKKSARVTSWRRAKAAAKPSAVETLMPTTATASEASPTRIISRIVDDEPHLKQQHDEAEPRQDVERGGVRQGRQPVHAGERQVAEDDSDDQLAEHRRLARAHRQLAADLRRGDDERQHPQELRDRVVRDARGHAATITRRYCQRIKDSSAEKPGPNAASRP